MTEGGAVIEAPVPVDVVMSFDVLAGNVAGLDVVLLVTDLNGIFDGDNVKNVTRVLSLASEDAKDLARRLNHVAAGVRPISKQVNREEQS